VAGPSTCAAPSPSLDELLEHFLYFFPFAMELSKSAPSILAPPRLKAHPPCGSTAGNPSAFYYWPLHADPEPSFDEVVEARKVSNR
jgi:hypothetical protein